MSVGSASIWTPVLLRCVNLTWTRRALGNFILTGQYQERSTLSLYHTIVKHKLTLTWHSLKYMTFTCSRSKLFRESTFMRQKMITLNNQEWDSWGILFYKSFLLTMGTLRLWKGCPDPHTPLDKIQLASEAGHLHKSLHDLVWGGSLWHLYFKGYQWHRSKAMLCKKLGTQPASSSSIASLEASLSMLLWIWTYIRSSQLNQWGNTNGHFIFIQLTRGSKWRASWDGMPEKVLEAELP